MTVSRPGLCVMTLNAKFRVEKLVCLCAALILICGVAGMEGSQDGRQVANRDSVLAPHPVAILLRDEGVWRHLELGDEQIAAVGAAVDAVDQRLWRLRDPVDEKRAEKVGELVTQLEAAVARVLSPRQWRRLEQLVLQAEGIEGILREDRARQLRLRKRQVRRIADRLAKMETALEALGAGRTDSAESVMRSQQLREAAERDVLHILDDYQRQILRRMVGPMYDLSRVRRRACRAPELTNVTRWFNSDPLTLKSLQGQVVILHFYCYGCINCVRNLPHYNSWADRFEGRGVQVVGIHRPETKAEYDLERVKAKIKEQGITYPVAVDNESTNWDAWANHTWPSVYLIDKQGFVRYWWYGELNWQGIQGERWFRQHIEEITRE